jgi:hypothetical protein
MSNSQPKEVLPSGAQKQDKQDAFDLADVIRNTNAYLADGKEISIAKLVITTDDGQQFFLHRYDHGQQVKRITKKARNE